MPEHGLKARKARSGVRPEAWAAHLGVVAAEQAVVAGPHAGALAVAVAATLRGTVASDKAKVAAAVVRLHARAIHAALGAHWAAQPRDTAGTGRGRGRAVAEPTLTSSPLLFHLSPL